MSRSIGSASRTSKRTSRRPRPPRCGRTRRAARTRRRGRGTASRRLRVAAALALGVVQVQHLLPRPVELALRRAGRSSTMTASRDRRRAATAAPAVAAPGAAALLPRSTGRMSTRAARRRALVEDVELPDRDDLVAPELDADGLRRAEAEQVEDAAAHGVLADRLDEAARSKPMASSCSREVGQAELVADGERQAQVGQAGRDVGELLQGARGGDEDAGAAGEQRLQRLDAQAADLEVVLRRLVGQRLALREERDDVGAEDRLQVGVHGLGLGRRRRDDDPDALRRVRRGSRRAATAAEPRQVVEPQRACRAGSGRTSGERRLAAHASRRYGCISRALPRTRARLRRPCPGQPVQQRQHDGGNRNRRRVRRERRADQDVAAAAGPLAADGPRRVVVEAQVHSLAAVGPLGENRVHQAEVEAVEAPEERVVRGAQA
jgi:hypothetical protein